MFFFYNLNTNSERNANSVFADLEKCSFIDRQHNAIAHSHTEHLNMVIVSKYNILLKFNWKEKIFLL